jgi:PKD repeat protein
VIRRGLVLAAAALTTLSFGGCHEIFCQGDPGTNRKWAFELVDGVYHCTTVEDKSPYAWFTVSPDAVVAGREVRLTGSGSSPTGPIRRWDWDLNGDNKFIDASGREVTTTFAQAGAQTVSVRVTDSEGRHGRADLELDVLDPAKITVPVPVIDAEPDCIPPGGTVTFDNSGSTDPDGTIREYRWEFPGASDRDDALISSGPGTIHVTYADEGTYTARLTVIDDEELVGGPVARDILVTTGPCASFTITPNPVAPYELVTFDASASRGDIARYEWDLDGREGYERTTTTPVTTTSYMGEHRPGSALTVGLRVSNAGGDKSATATGVVRFESASTPGGPPPGEGPVSAAARRPAGKPFTARLRADTFGRHRGSLRVSRRNASVTGRVQIGKLRGRLLGRKAARGPLAKYLRAVWLGRLSMRASRRTGRLSMSGLAYARFERAPGGACVRLRLSAHGRHRTGTLVTQGGNGDGRNLALSARFRWRAARGGGLALRGKIASRRIQTRLPSEACLAVRDLRP